MCAVARVLLGVSGGIAAYKACELCRLLVREGHDVTPLLTPEAETFVSAKTFEALARREMPRDLYPHLIEADLLVIAPLTANTLAKLAHGLADSVLTQAALAFPRPRARGAGHERSHVGAPGDAGQRAPARRARRRADRPGGGRAGRGGDGSRADDASRRRSSPAATSCSVRAALWRESSVLVSAGGTREPLDAVRYLGNRSSGRMGVALAEEARRRGADVTLLAANLAVRPPPGVTVVETRDRSGARRGGVGAPGRRTSC